MFRVGTDAVMPSGFGNVERAGYQGTTSPYKIEGGKLITFSRRTRMPSPSTSSAIPTTPRAATSLATPTTNPTGSQFAINPLNEVVNQFSVNLGLLETAPAGHPDPQRGTQAAPGAEEGLLPERTT